MPPKPWRVSSSKAALMVVASGLWWVIIGSRW